MNARMAAAALGLKTYVGSACKHGHEGLRSTSNGACRKCQEIWAKKNIDKIPKIRRKSHLANKEKNNARSSTYSRLNREKRNATHKAWINAHPGWYADRAAAKLLRVPKWAKTPQHQVKIEDIYREAEDLTKKGFPHEVDHYYPLRGKTVSGLHVAQNLMVIPSKINHMKHNKHPNDFYIPEVESKP